MSKPRRSRNPHSRIVRATCGLLLALTAPLPANALTLDWAANPWSGTGVRTETFTVDGDDVTVTVTDNSNVIRATSGLDDGFAPGSLATNNYLTTPSDPGTDSLFIKTDENTAANTGGEYVTVDVDFAHVGGVTDVEFSFFDVDLLPPGVIFWFIQVGFTDEIELTGGYGLNTFAPSSVSAVAGASPTWSFDGTDTVTGTTEAATGSDDGTVVVRFDQVIDRFSFEYRNTLDTGQVQWISLSNISFNRVPEPASAPLLAFGLVWLAARRGRGSRLPS